MLEWACEVTYATSRDVSPSALTGRPSPRQRADRIATSVASLAEPWITPPPSPVERNRRGAPATRASSRASTSRPRCTPGT